MLEVRWTPDFCQESEKTKLEASATLGRFLQPDPAKYLDTMNLYQYCFNNPLIFKDPFGLGVKDWLKENGSVIGFVGGGIFVGVGVAMAACGAVVPGAIVGIIGIAGIGIGLWADSKVPEDATKEVKQEGEKWHQRTRDTAKELFPETEWEDDEKPHSREVDESLCPEKNKK